MRQFILLLLSVVSVLGTAQNHCTASLQEHQYSPACVEQDGGASMGCDACGKAVATPVVTVTPVSHQVQQVQDTVTTMWMPFMPAVKKVRVTGYRVQVYAGGNTRNAKSKAYQAEALMRRCYPEYAIYTRFVNPRWICHVGDFRTREEAAVLLSELRETKKFPEAIIVKCKVNVPLWEDSTTISTPIGY
ncbi:MAG: SPOR domain-containing protein [Bacteroidaceae bacterium]|nr:SPOR domain-containing protein [Bacteroidaceae bacterium]